MIKTGNTVWYNRAWYYFHNSDKAGVFCGEFNFIRRELGIIKPYTKKDTDTNTNTGNI